MNILKAYGLGIFFFSNPLLAASFIATWPSPERPNTEIILSSQTLSSYPLPEISLIEIKTDENLNKEKLQELAKKLGAISIEPNQTITIAPNEHPHSQNPEYSDNPEDPERGGAFWYHDKLETLRAQRSAGTLSKVIVAVIDTGVDLTHPLLAENFWANTDEIANNEKDDDGNGLIDDARGWDFKNNQSSPQDDNGHGTHIAGLIAAKADRSGDVFGVAPNALIMPIKVFNQYGQGDLATAIKGAAYAIRMGAQVLNFSFGVPNPSRSFEDLMRTLERNDVVAVAAAGNASNNNDARGEYPANSKYWHVISVAGTNANDEIMDISNFGQLSVTMSAPGENILSLDLAGKTKVRSGTSFATPLVAGGLALLKGMNSKKTFAEILPRLYTSSNKNPKLLTKVQGAGRANLYQMIKDKKEVLDFPFKESKWKKTDQVIESDHPYFNNTRDLKTLEEPTATWWKLAFEKIEIEPGYDSLELSHFQGNILATLSGEFRPELTYYIPASSLQFTLSSDGSDSFYGYKIHSSFWGTP